MLGPSDSDRYDSEWTDDIMQQWIVCPSCGSDDADLVIWGDGYDSDFHCYDCGHNYGVR